MRNYQFKNDLENINSEYQGLRKRGVENLETLYQFYRDDVSSVIKTESSENISESLFFEYFQFDLKFRTQIEFKQISGSMFEKGFISTYLVESISNGLPVKKLIFEMEFDRYGLIDGQYSIDDFYGFYLNRFLGQLLDFFRKCGRWEPFKQTK